MADPQSSSPVQEVSFGDAVNLSLDNYYDILKAQVGGLNAKEFLQLKLVADSLDLSGEPGGNGQGGYKWYSYYNLLQRSDVAVYPGPLSGQVHTSATDMTEVYGNFVRRLRQFVVRKELTPEEQGQLADLDKKAEAVRRDMMNYTLADRQSWRQYAELMGFSFGDQTAYVQWSGSFGHLRDIERKIRELQIVEFDKKTILDRAYPDPDDRAVVESEFDFENPSMRLRYPIFPDTDYANGLSFNLSYLANLPLGSTALFNDRRVISFDKTIETIKTSTAGSFSATLNRSTQESTSIHTDWKASGSAKFSFLKVNADASEMTKISSDFQKGRNLTLSAEATFKVGLNYPNWLRPSLFEHKRVRENPHEFQDFFGENGSLLYYPTQLIVVRGFAIEFESSQTWSYDYENRFSASGGGGFRAFGINFGSSASYNKHVKEHKVDKSQTKLRIADDQNTLRFVGLTVKKNTVFEESAQEVVRAALGRETERVFA